MWLLIMKLVKWVEEPVHPADSNVLSKREDNNLGLRKAVMYSSDIKGIRAEHQGKAKYPRRGSCALKTWTIRVEGSYLIV